jgi:hypothetical protein
MLSFGLGLADDWLSVMAGNVVEFDAILFRSSMLSFGLGLADDWLSVMAGNVVEFDAILVEIVEHTQTSLVALPVVWLRSSSTKKDKKICFIID